MPLTSGTKLGPYEIQSLLGAGGMGEVYLALDTRLQRTVAIKILPAHLSSSPDLHARFVQEAKSISSLQHPNICVVHDIGSQDGVDYMVMEYVAGQTLDKADPARWPAGQCGHEVRAANRRCPGARPCRRHRSSRSEAGERHGRRRGLVKVLDFGLAKLAAAESATGDTDATIAATGTATTPGMIVGTLAYMSPEQAEGKPIDARSDIFSFGAVFYEMLAGAKAFDGASSAALLAAVMRDDPKPLSELKRDVPPELRDIVARCLKKNPADRYASGAELAQELRRCREVLFPESGAALSPARMLHEAKRPRILIPVLALLILLGVGVGWLVQRSRETRWAREVGAARKSPGSTTKASTEMRSRSPPRAEKAIPGDPALAKLWPVISYEVTIDSTPEGADVYRREYSDPNAPWELVGKTPLKSLRQPRGMFLWKFEKPGYQTSCAPRRRC